MSDAPVAGRRARGGWSDAPASNPAPASNSNPNPNPSTSTNSNSNSNSNSNPNPNPSGRRRQEPSTASSQASPTNEDDGDIPVIPDLEDENGAGEDFQQSVADAPEVLSTKVQSLRELEKEAKRTLPHPRDPDVDLSVLTSGLPPPEHAMEEDAVWDPQVVFVQAMGELEAVPSTASVSTTS